MTFVWFEWTIGTLMPVSGRALVPLAIGSALAFASVSCTLTSNVSDLTSGNGASASTGDGGEAGEPGGGAPSSGGTAAEGGAGGLGPGGGGGESAAAGRAGSAGEGGEPELGARAVYWVDSNSNLVQGASIDGTGVETIVTIDTSTAASYLRSIAVDEQNQKLYFTDSARGNVLRANLEGGGLEPLIVGLQDPVGIDLDVPGGKVYFADQGTPPVIYRANLDGSALEPIVDTMIDNPYGLVLDHETSTVYFVDNGVDAIFRVGFDGSDLQNLGITGLLAPIEIALDPVGQKIYWSDIGPPPVVRRANFDGTEAEDLVTQATLQGFSVPLGIAVDPARQKFYFVDGGTSGLDAILSADLDGSNVRPLIVGLDDPRGLALAF